MADASQHLQTAEMPPLKKSEEGRDRLILLIGFNGMQGLDLVGPLEVFSKAHRQTRPGSGEGYRVVIASMRGGCIKSNSGMCVAGIRKLADVHGDIDTIVVAGGADQEVLATREGEDLVRWLAGNSGRGRRVAAVCTGAFLLAAAGLLDRRRVTTHWASCARLAEAYPAAAVVSDSIFVADGNVYTSAGVTAGIDLALALVEEDLGPRVAQTVARDLVLYFRRPGGQAQLSATLAAQAEAPHRLRNLLGWINDHPADDLTIPSLAKQVGMSERNFGRHFAARTGMTPRSYVELIRLERVKLLLETTDFPLSRIAAKTGLGGPARVASLCKRHLQQSPLEYRRRYRPQRQSIPRI